MRSDHDEAISLLSIYNVLLGRYGTQYWWPADSPFEMMVGAILTQNTSWRNVEMAIATLKRVGEITPGALLIFSESELQQLIRSAGFFRQKERYLRHLAKAIVEDYGGDALALLRGETLMVRRRLLALPGVGPETADSMLLYAGEHPVFVVDAYTRRIFLRLGLLAGDECYAAVQKYCMDNLPHSVSLFNEYHALLVRLAKEHCLSRKPRCAGCSLRQQCVYTQCG